MRPFPVALAALLAALLLVPGTAVAVSVGPVSAAGFRDSVGVNTHVNYFDTAYGRWPEIVARLDELGVDHLRDGAYNPTGWTSWNKRYRDAVGLAASHGKRFTFVMGAPGWQAGSLPELLDVVAGPLRPAAEALEAPNEFDLESGLLDWVSPLRSYVQDLHAGAKADPRLAGLPIAGPSLVHRASRDQLGDLSDYVDRGNMHAYAGGLPPGQAKLADEWWLAQKVTRAKTPWVTETGFHNATNALIGQPGVPEGVAAAYTLRTLLEHYRFGIERTFLYELVDEKPEPANLNPEQHFGLLRNDLSRKPAFAALRNLLRVLGRPGAPGTLNPVEMSVDGDTSGVAALLLQEPDGVYRFVMWRTASLWDTVRRRRIPVPVKRVGLTLPAGAATLARPKVSAAATALAFEGRRTVVDVPTDPVVVTFRVPPVTTAARTTTMSATTAAAAGQAAADAVPGGPAPSDPVPTTMSEPAAAAERSLRLRVCTAPGSRLRASVGVARPGRRLRRLASATVVRRSACRVELTLPAGISSAGRQVARIAHHAPRAKAWTVVRRAL